MLSATAFGRVKMMATRPMAVSVRTLTQSSTASLARTSIDDPMDHPAYQFSKSEEHHQVAPLTTSGIYVANSSVDDHSIFTPTINAVFDE